MKLENIFEKIGQVNYNHKLMVLIGTLTITALCSIGLVFIRLENDAQNLWVDHQSIGYQQQMNFNDQYGAFFRTQQIILAQNQQQQKNIFTHEHLYGFYFLINLINERTTTLNHREIKIDDLCYRPINGKGCYRPSPLDIWKMNITDLHADDNIQYTAMCINSRSLKSRIPCSDENEIPILKESIYGGITCDDSMDNKSSYVIPCDHCWIEAKALMATYLLNNDEYTGESAAAWERDVLIDSIHKFNADDGSFIQEYKKYFDVDDDGWVEFEGGLKLNLQNYTSSAISSHFEYLSERSIPDELTNETSENMAIVIISYTIMLVYIGIAIGQFPSTLTSGFMLAIVGIFIVLASVVSSMGIIAYLGIGFTMISAEVIPFLVLAIGVDNMFILKSTIERQRGELQQRVCEGLKEVGPNITTATVCEVAAFLVGSLTRIPALQAFCLQAAIAILINYFFQIFTFIVCLILDEQRKDAGRVDVFCCVQGDHQPGEPKHFWKKVFAGPYFQIIKSPLCFGVVMIIALALLTLSVIGMIFVPVGLNQQVSMDINSDLFNYFTYEKKYIEIGPPAYIVFNNFDYQNQTHVQLIENLNNELSNLKYIQPPVFSWFASFNNFLKDDAQWSDICQSSDINTFTYEQQLRKFLDITIESGCCQSYGICGEQYDKDLIFDDEGKLVSTRLRVMHKPLRNSYDYIRAARETRMAVDYILGDLLEKDESLSAYPYSLFYIYYDQYSYIRSVAIENLLLALAVVFLFVTLIKEVKIALVICGVVLLTTLNLIGFVYVTNSLFPDHGFIVEVNAISVVNLITCVGLSVEFTAHMCIGMFERKGTQDEKLQATLEKTGSAVFIGIGLTKFAGVIVLALAASTIFRLYYFRMYLGIVLLGIFNGLVLLPILLYRFGPRSYEEVSSLVTTNKQD